MKSKIFVSIFISLILISSIIGYMFGGSEGQETVKYKGYKFTNINENWVVNIGKQQVFISERPDLLENISAPKLKFSYLNSMNKVYLSLNPEDKLDSSLYLFSMNILSKLKPVIVRACVEDSEECKEMPLKSCDDATSSVFVIMMQRGEKYNSYDNNCLTIKGNTADILKYLNKLTLNLLI